jgi:hypothetical protein
MANKDLLRFMRESRRRGFSDDKVREALLSNGWPLHEISKGFHTLSMENPTKNSLTIWLDTEVMLKLNKRAKKNLMTLPEQIEDILRRSVINTTGVSSQKEKLDDMLVGLFSRKKRK